MMGASRVRYATSRDGTSIAYSIIGQGPPVILARGFFNGSIEGQLEREDFSGFYAALSATRSLVVFDWRNSGLSGSAADLTLSALVDDIGQVARHAGIDRFDLVTQVRACHIGLEFAAINPQIVRRLVLIRPVPAFSGSYAFWLKRQQLALLDWQALTTLIGVTSMGWSESGRKYAEQLRKQWTPAAFAAFLTELDGFDNLNRALSVLPECLVIALGDDRDEVVQMTRRVASLLPNGHLSFFPVYGVRGEFSPELAEAINNFLGEWESETPAPLVVGQGFAFRTILFTDIESHTAMMQRLGDSKGREVLREHERITREALAAHGGAEVKTMGDGFMASFGSAQKAVECAIALQKAFGGVGGSLEPPARGGAAASPAGENREPIRVRVGINAGEPIAEDDDLFGSSVILAARTAAKASGGEILVTDVVRLLVAGKGFVFSDRGETEMRGFDEPMRLYEVRWN
jgi:class 3 adenylate cyclase